MGGYIANDWTYIKSNVYIYANGLDKRAIGELIEGIGEEGLSYEFFDIGREATAELFATLAEPNAPNLAPGACTNGAEVRLLGSEGALLAVYNGQGKDLRNLGANAARYIKKLPLKLV